MTYETRELDLNELDAVSGGSFWSLGVQAIQTAMVIGGINSVLGQAVDGIPPAPCHPKG